VVDDPDVASPAGPLNPGWQRRLHMTVALVGNLVALLALASAHAAFVPSCQSILLSTSSRLTGIRPTRTSSLLPATSILIGSPRPGPE